jgi:membrane protease subunit HflC
MTRGKVVTLVVIIIIALIVVGSALYTISESEQAIITQFGKPIGDAVTSAGLHVKIPFIHAVHRFEKRILIWDGEESEVPTADKKYIRLNTTARWRIKDPLLFYQSVGNTVGAQARLDDIIDSAARDVVSSNVLIEVVRNSNELYNRTKARKEDETAETEEESVSEVTEKIEEGREALTEKILASASKLVPQYGIEILDVKIKRLNYVEDVQQKVYERMISERQRIASKYRSEGEGKKAEILGSKDRELEKIQSEAYRKAQGIKGKADAEATKIYASAYRKDPEFYSFLKTLEIYQNTVGENSRAILTTDSDIYKYLKDIREK